MAKDKKDKTLQTDIWQKFELSKDYEDKKRLLQRTERNWNFFVGHQWKGLNSFGEELPVLNFIKTIVQYKISSVAQNAMTAYYSDMEMRTELAEVYKALNLYWRQCWEKSKMNEMCWRMLKSAAIQGDSYFYWHDGNTLEPPQIIPNTSIHFADENIDNIQEQEYIIIEERWGLEEVRKFAKENGVSEEEIKLINADDNTDRQLYNKDEVSDKVTVLLYMTKNENGVVETGRSTESVIIEPLEAKVNQNGVGEIKGNLTVYPVINYVWESLPNTARGVGEVEMLIPNQLELNKTLARRSMAVKMAAYPRLAYDATAVGNPEDLDKVGAPIAVQGGSAQSINQMIAYLNPANISSDALQLSNDLLQTTKDLAGASDYALGNINPEQASGTAIIAVRDQSQVPLNEQVSRFKQFVEDVSILWIDLWIVFNADGITFEYEDEQGNKIPVSLSQKDLEDLKPTVMIDVSPDNQWTKLAEQQSLDTLLQLQQITLEEYVECTPDNSSVPKAKLQQVMNKRKALQAQQEQQMMMMQAQNQFNPDVVMQELINQGVPEEEAIGMVQQMMAGNGMNA
jgi:hypothetical protein